ncbi:hypothetical protein [Phocaeicola faecicola]|uniref:hypothetical protein n=1 Tax=Phocaeicola faecicola TaxID=2739389 RepID=UPI0015E6EFDC|nr:hypothetical protein [Phocaeicola faecicola]
MEQKTRQKIEANAALKAQLAKNFGVTVQFVSQALLFGRNSDKAKRIREAALKSGGVLLNITVADAPQKIVKVLDSHGNVKQVINQ